MRTGSREPVLEQGDLETPRTGVIEARCSPSLLRPLWPTHMGSGGGYCHIGLGKPLRSVWVAGMKEGHIRACVTTLSFGAWYVAMHPFAYLLWQHRCTGSPGLPSRAPRTTEMSSVFLLEAGGPKTRCWRGCAPCGTSRKGNYLACPCFWWPLTFLSLWWHCSNLCLIVTWLSFPCMSHFFLNGHWLYWNKGPSYSRRTSS